MKTEYTLEPWQVVVLDGETYIQASKPLSGLTEHYRSKGNSGRALIARIHKRPQQKAIAALVSAVPEMAEILRQLRDCSRYPDNDEGNANLRFAFEMFREKARAVLKKAGVEISDKVKK